MCAIGLLCFSLTLSFSLALKGFCRHGVMVSLGGVEYIESPNYPSNTPADINCVWYVTCSPRGKCFFDCEDVQLAQSDRLVLSTRGDHEPYYFGDKDVNNSSFTAESADFRFSLGYVTSPSSTGSRFRCRVHSEYVPEDIKLDE